MNNANRHHLHCWPGRLKLLRLRKPELMHSGSYRYIDTGPDKEEKELSLLPSFFGERLIMLSIIYRQNIPPHAFPFTSWCVADLEASPVTKTIWFSNLLFIKSFVFDW